ncbi:MAG: M20/M25/M40 family metallo-hydrolase [Anaerolineae bacterium]|nr:M20/M25/M40 family metallo-hydrolase [Thermoflexales bacterium]
MSTTRLAAEAVELLQNLIRFDTSNPPGNEMPAAQFVAHILRQNGLEPTVIETAPGRGNVIARLKGTGAAAPLLLYSHLDVVPVEREKWSVDPFGGVIKDGYVYGRGALDMKGIGAMQLAVFLALARAKTPLARDIIFAMTADEETSANQGIGILVEKYPELLRAEYALSEFGGFSLHLAGKTFYPVQTAEKGTCWMRLRAKGRPGHASVPHNDNAVIHLGRALAKLQTAQTPMHLTQTARGYLLALADGLGGGLAARLRALANAGKAAPREVEAMWNDRELVASGLRDELYAITHNTFTPTGLRAGKATNVIPAEADAVIDCRTLPGCDANVIKAELMAALGDAANKVEIIVDSESPPLEFNPDTSLFDLIRKTITRADPGAIPMPYMLTGATDAKHMAKLGTICYGFSPMKFAAGERFTDLVHGHDERVAIDSLGWGVEVLRDVVEKFCA